MSLTEQKCLINFYRIKKDELDVFAVGVRNGIFQNSGTFTTPPIIETVYDGQITTYINTRGAYVQGGLAQKGPFLAARTNLIGSLTTIATYVDTVAAGDANIITLAGMLPTFRVDYETEFNKLTLLFNQIPSSVLNQRVMTDDKTIANNKLYDWTIKTGKAANVIFYTEAETAIREKFVFSNVLSTVSSSGPAMLKGKVTDTDNNPINTADVFIGNLDAEIQTDELGNYSSGNIPSGTYNVIFQKEGFVSQELIINLNKGVTKIQDVVLTAV